MKTIIFNTLIFASILFFSSCQKKPVATFTTDKETYSVGESVFISNDSKNSDYYQWVIKGPNSEKRENTQNPQIRLNDYGTYEITLLCYSRNRKLSNVYSKTITVEKAIDGFYTIYTNNVYSSTVKIYVDNVYSGTIYSETLGTAYCGQPTGLTIPITPGAREIKALFQAYSGTKTYNIVANSNSCNLFYISY